MNKQIVIFTVIFGWLSILTLIIILAHFSTPDFTDTGVGCIDDCLELDTHK